MVSEMWKCYCRRFQPGEGPSRGLLRDCETDGSFYSTTRGPDHPWPAITTCPGRQHIKTSPIILDQAADTSVPERRPTTGTDSQTSAKFLDQVHPFGRFGLVRVGGVSRGEGAGQLWCPRHAPGCPDTWRPVAGDRLLSVPLLWSQ